MTTNLTELRGLIEKATPGPYEHTPGQGNITAAGEYLAEGGSLGSLNMSCTRGPDQRDHDLAYIAAALNALPSLLDEIESDKARLAKAREALEGTLHAIEQGNLYDRMCCNGVDCGCMGSTHADYAVHHIRAALCGTAPNLAGVFQRALEQIAEMTDVEADFDGFQARTIARTALADLGEE